MEFVACSCAAAPQRAPIFSLPIFLRCESERDDLLLRIMGSPDERQIDGLGGAHPLTSKVAVIEKSNTQTRT